jgi:hypothetical protein
MWQLTHAFGSALKYDNPSAYLKVKAPVPARRPISTANMIAFFCSILSLLTPDPVAREHTLLSC